MKLVELRLENFRQFMGKQEIRFAGDAQKSVSVFFGANGSGKTTLLNAFTWCLYGVLSEDVEARERLVTEAVWRAAPFGSQVHAMVELEFEHNGSLFRCRRESESTKATDHQRLEAPRLQLWETTATGATKEIIAGQQKIESILPQRLSQFFFFNGERIEKLVKDNAYAEIKQAIKSLLGLEQVERAIEHLPKVERKLNADLRKHGGDQLAAIGAQLAEVRDKAADGSKRMEELEGESKSLAVERRRVQELLQQHASAAPLQARREEIDSELANTKEELRTVGVTRRRIISERGFLAFVGGVSEQTCALADELTAKGQLPAPLKRDFVEGLLEQEACLCGTSLSPGSDARMAVEAWRAKVGLAEVEGSWIRLRGSLGLVDDARAQLRTELEDSSSKLAELGIRLKQLHEKKTKVDAELQDIPLEDVRRLDDKHRGLEQRIASVHAEMGALKLQLEEYVTQHEGLTNSLKTAEVKDQLAARIRSRMAVVDEVHSALEEILQIRTESVRRDLDERIRSVYGRISVKPSEPHLTDDFELKLVYPGDESMTSTAKSTGENQILSLSFVAAVSELASEYRHRGGSDDLLEEGGHFPVVMDAAFGSLDENYQRDVSEALSRLAPQMVVFVSKSQGLGTVMRELEPHVGRLGIVVANTTKSDNADEDIEFGGQRFPYIRTRQESDCAQIMEVL